MAFDGFIKFKDIDGESADTKHPGWIEINECNLQIQQTISTTVSSAGGAAAERADFSDFCLTKLLDKSSPLLALACAKGKHFDKVTIDLCRAGSEKIKFLEIQLSDVLISHIAMNAGGEFPSETIHLNYSEIQWTYTQQSRQGGRAMGNVAAGWNRRKNCPA